MKKIYYCLFAICSFFIFSFGVSANTQLFIDNSSPVIFGNRGCDDHHITNFLGYQIYTDHCLSRNSSARFNVYYDYYNVSVKSDSDFYNYSSLKYLFDNSLKLYSILLTSLPTEAVVKDYYTISYLYSAIDGYISLYLIFYDSPIVYNDFESIKTFSLKNPSNDSTFVYKFKLSYNGVSYVTFKSVSYDDILSSIGFTGTSLNRPSVILSSSDGYYVNPTFYNFFFDSNFSINYNVSYGDNSINPNYIINRIKNNDEFVILRDNYFSDYKLDYFKFYAFSGGTTGIQSFSNVINYKDKLKPPFNGGYGTFTFSYYLRKNILKYVGDVNINSSVIYYQGGLIITYLENDELSLKKSTFAVNCDKTGKELCSFTLDFSNLENPSVLLYYESNILAEAYNFYYSSYPSVWYKLKDFEWYSMSNDDEAKLSCYNCNPDDDGNYPSIRLPNSELEIFLNSIDIDYTNNTSLLSSLFSNAFSNIKVFVNSSIELLSLVSSFFYSLPIVVQSFLIVLFIISMIYIFIRFIS